jgi:hypothetical protein
MSGTAHCLSYRILINKTMPKEPTNVINIHKNKIYHILSVKFDITKRTGYNRYRKNYKANMEPLRSGKKKFWHPEEKWRN